MITIQKDKIKECILETQCLLACDDEDVVTDIFTFAWQACAAHYEAELLKRDALIADKDKALQCVKAQLIDGKIFTVQLHQRPYWRYEVE